MESHTVLGVTRRCGLHLLDCSPSTFLTDIWILAGTRTPRQWICTLGESGWLTNVSDNIACMIRSYDLMTTRTQCSMLMNSIFRRFI